MENDTETGGEETSLSIEQAASAFVKATSPEAAETGQAEDEELEQGTETDDELQASDEDEGEEADGETDDEGQAGDENDEEPDSDQGRFVASNGKVRLPDGTVSTVADLIQGNLRDRDYRQKTMETAELRKSFESQSTAVKEREQQLEQQSKYVTDLIRSILPEAPDPAMANPQSPTYDPARYIAEKAAYEQWGQHLAYLDSQQQQTAQQRQAEAQKQQAERAEREWNALTEKVPAFKDKAKWEAFASDANKFGAQYGFTPEELRGLAYDHRQITVLRKAILWDKLQASKPKVQQKVEGRPPVQKGGKRLNPAEHKARQGNEALTRLKQSGTVEDAAAAYIASLNKG
jgi:hypothetical protein